MNLRLVLAHLPINRSIKVYYDLPPFETWNFLKMATPNDKDDLPFQDVFANAVTDDGERMNLLATKWTTVLKYPFPTRYTFLFVSLKNYWNGRCWPNFQIKGGNCFCLML